MDERHAGTPARRGGRIRVLPTFAPLSPAPRLPAQEVPAMPRRLRLLFTPTGWLLVVSAVVTLSLLVLAWKSLR